MYSFQIKNSLIFSNYLELGNAQVSEEIKKTFSENLENDFELLKTIYADNIEEIAKDTEEAKKTFAFKIKLILEFEVNANFFEIVKELKIPEVCDNEFNSSAKDSEKRILNLPYYVSFHYAEAEGIKVDLFLFWLKRNNTFYEEFKKNVLVEIKDDLYFNSFFFCFIEHLKSNLLAPDKNYLLFILQEINEISVIKSKKDDIFELLEEFFIRRKRTNANESNLIFLNLNNNNNDNVNQISKITENNLNNTNKNEYEESEFDEENLESALNLNSNSFASNLSQIKKRSDRLLENSINKKNQQLTNAVKNPNNNQQQQQAEENNHSEYESFFTIGGIKGEVSTDRGSAFQAHAIKISAFDQVNKFTKMLLVNNKIQKATHNIMAYRFLSKEASVKDELKESKVKTQIKDKNSKSVVANFISEGFDDDGEAGAGVRLLGILQKMKIYNVFVIVSRWFGGTLLGNDRFKHINDTAKDLLLLHKSKFDYES